MSYYERNKEKVLARQSSEEGKEKRKAKDKAYYERKKEEISRKARENPETKLKDKLKYEKNKEKRKEQSRQYSNKPDAKWKILNKQAAKRNLVVEISFDEAVELWQQPCHYCNNKHEIKLGSIDRKDNTIGYTKINCLPSCWGHNKLKGNFTYDEFVDLVNTAYRHLNK